MALWRMINYNKIQQTLVEGLIITVPIFMLSLFLLEHAPSLVSTSSALYILTSLIWLWFIYNSYHSNNVFGIASTAIISIVMVVSIILIGYSGFSDTGYTIVSNGKDASLVFVVDGDFPPSKQELYIGDIATDDISLQGMSVSVNGVLHVYNKTLQNKGVKPPISSLKPGKNTINIKGSGIPSLARISYVPEYKPVIKRIQLPAMAVGRPVELFVYAEDENAKNYRTDEYYDNNILDGQSRSTAGQQDQVNTNIIIVDYRNETVLDMTFNGSKTVLAIEDIGNYGIYARVFDGVGFSDVYYAEFTVFEGVPYTIDVIPVSTNPVQHPFSDTLLPIVFTGNDNEVIKFTKKCVNGYYTYSKDLENRLR